MSLLADRTASVIFPRGGEHIISARNNALRIAAGANTSSFGVPPAGMLQAEQWWKLSSEGGKAPLTRYSAKLGGFEVNSSDHARGMLVSPRNDGSVIFGVRDSNSGFSGLRFISANVMQAMKSDALRIASTLIPDGEGNEYLAKRRVSLSQDIRRMSEVGRNTEQQHCSWTCAGGADGSGWTCWEGSCYDDGMGYGGWGGGAVAVQEWQPGGASVSANLSPYGGFDQCLVDGLGVVAGAFAAYAGVQALMDFLFGQFALGMALADVAVAVLTATAAGFLAAACGLYIALFVAGVAAYVHDNCLA